ncbi:FadR/GntR family transcriptional regulator [Aliiglaciecola lipolytica]|uniref:GntR family transcriptional regulator, uxuAB operon transcriptional repressor n=1 Tax=Aliiglaciecola lipolytica E3 TaxID=1127673 RepID=K6YD43_9ALTE|nr:FadR/GntR family transcriptional regulator [Aliiglaciecola lipolytica]GAC16122.1 GntR family transcriptional regulator, uxuAB operon transcriptional repressor [Aliiglaciecola lipolytica E3]
MKNRRMFWHIVDKIESQIDSGRYPVGSRLPPERELAENFDVSRPTIREAIIALEVRGRVEVKVSSGVYVLDTTSKYKSIPNISAFELTQARALVEGEAAALAAMAITDKELEALDHTLQAMEKGIEPENADREFHTIIATATRNTALLQSIQHYWKLRETLPQIISEYKNVCSSSDKDRLEEHRRIYNALKKHDSQEARAAMHGHFNRLINSLFEISEAKALEEVKRKSSETRDRYSITHLVG